MSTETTPDLEERNRIYYEAMIGSIAKFRLFWCALVFSILSFSMQFPTKSHVPWLKIVEWLSWIGFAIVGGFALRDCGGIRKKMDDKIFEGLAPMYRVLMWGTFLTAMGLLIIAKIMDSLVQIL